LCVTAACLACGNFILCFPDESRAALPSLYPMFFRNLEDPIPSVRQGAASSLTNIVRACGQEALSTVMEKVTEGLKGVRNQPAESERYRDMDHGQATFGVVKRLRDNDPDLHSDKQMYSCGSLAPRMGRGGCSDPKFRRASQPWEMADGCVYLLSELSQIPDLARSVFTALPLVAEACHYRHYTHHIVFLETVCKQLPVLAKGIGKKTFKPVMEEFLDPIFYALTGRTIMERCKEHQRSIRLYYPDKSAVAQHSLETGHKIDFSATTILDKTSGYWDLVIKEAIEIQLDVNNFNRDGNIVRNGNIKIGDLSFEEVEKFKYLGATVTNINDTREAIKRRINMGNACYYSVVKLLSSSLLSKNLKVRIYKTVILPVVLYGCETWTLTLREEHRLRVFENKVLRKIFWAKRDEVTGEWRKLHNTELHALYSSPDIIKNIKSRRLRWAGHVARMGESRNAYRVLVGRLEGKRPLGRPRRRWEDNIKMDLREVGYDDRDWINLAQDRDQWRAYVRAAMNLWECENALTSSAASQCLNQIGALLGPSILRAKVERHNPKYV
ncbi:hypothetical protein ANN_27330, partial [Periplaneta americana]